MAQRICVLFAVLTFLSVTHIAVQAQEKPCSDLEVHITKMPLYPSVALAAHFEGKIHIDMEVSPEGKILNIESVEGPELLQQAAKSYVLGWELGWQEDRKHKACSEKVIVDYKLMQSFKGVSSYSYEIVTQDGTSSTSVIARQTYYTQFLRY